MHDVTFHAEPERRVAAIAHTGIYQELATAFAAAGQALGAAQAFGRVNEMIAVYHDDPKTTPANKLRSHAGFVLKHGQYAPEGMDTLLLRAARCVVLRHQGPYEGLAQSYDWLLSVWLPASGEVRAQAPTFEIYLNTPENTAPADLVTMVYLPLEEADFNGPI
ncbi:MAG TPA: hypothetical protein DD416_11485 [Rhodobacteraceae bacterium]|jgi:AraC family transcriptional regulator|nr:GyrI-like domain-containing protein [Rhodobacter sp.]HBN31814.1 hypothetical protein [Paracoccaceae bacterium]